MSNLLGMGLIFLSGCMLAAFVGRMHGWRRGFNEGFAMAKRRHATDPANPAPQKEPSR